jgi:hypothetical protein
MYNNYIYLAVAVILLVSFVYFGYFALPKTHERYSITLGMLAPQNKFYAKCTSDCVREKTGDSYPGQFQWLCTDKCANIAESRIKNNVPDLSTEEHQRHGGGKGGPHWDSEYLESAYCMNDMITWCKERYCPFSNHADCMKDCIKMKGVECSGGLVGGWMP